MEETETPSDKSLAQGQRNVIEAHFIDLESRKEDKGDPTVCLGLDAPGYLDLLPFVL